MSSENERSGLVSLFLGDQAADPLGEQGTVGQADELNREG